MAQSLSRIPSRRWLCAPVSHPAAWQFWRGVVATVESCTQVQRPSYSTIEVRSHIIWIFFLRRCLSDIPASVQSSIFRRVVCSLLSDVQEPDVQAFCRMYRNPILSWNPSISQTPDFPQHPLHRIVATSSPSFSACHISYASAA